MYINGQGVIQNYIKAHKWINISAASGYENAAKYRDIFAKKMTQSQIEKAQELASQWMVNHP